MIEDEIVRILKALIRPDERVLLYGAGRIGAAVRCAAQKMGSVVDAFLDSNAGGYFDGGEAVRVPIYSIEDDHAAALREEPVLLSLFCGQEEADRITGELKKRGFQRTIYSKELLACFCEYGPYRTDQVDWPEQQDRIALAYGLMADSHSRELMECILHAYVTKDYTQMIESQGTVQYFDVNVPLDKGYGHFVDCGAYNGDSLTCWLQMHEGRSYVGFEPDISNFEKLVRVGEGLKKELDDMLLLPCAVSGQNGYASFSMSKEQGSRLDERPGGESVLTVRLDDVLSKKQVTMLKMDIEGAETDALKGAHDIIVSQKPDLAVCVYHRMADLWEIPLLLRQWVPEYKFYLRCHALFGMETVLYATI